MKGRAWVVALALVALAAVSPVMAQGDLPSRDELDDGWNWLAPGGETTCSDGSPYQFAVREGPGEDLMIYFQGGGACWSALTCAPINPTFLPAVVPEYVEQQGDGIFNLEHPDNPFADYDMVVIPYCTGDVFMGDSVQEYGSGANAVTIRHNGFTNATVALDWIYANFPAPESVFITGESAGGLGASFHAPWIIEQYPETRIAVLGDSAGGYSAPNLGLSMVLEPWGTIPLLPDWIPALAEVDDPTELAFEDLYSAAAAHYPDVIFAQYNTLHDRTQQFFLSLVRGTPRLEDVLPGVIDKISASAPNFYSFLAGGDEHTILHRPEFYTTGANGVRIRDWVAALASGEPIESVTCDPCDAPEIFAP